MESAGRRDGVTACGGTAGDWDWHERVPTTVLQPQLVAAADWDWMSVSANRWGGTVFPCLHAVSDSGRRGRPAAPDGGGYPLTERDGPEYPSLAVVRASSRGAAHRGS